MKNGMTNVSQALVLVGGRASRLKRDGIEVPFSKAFLPLADRPLLFWTLHSLYIAGVRSLVIAGNKVIFLHKAKAVLRTLPFQFDHVVYFHDLGLGVHGVPYEARYLLDETFLFVCGHGISTPAHYQRIARMKQEDTVVFSAFTPHPQNPRQPVMLNQSQATLIASVASGNRAALAHPIVADQTYARRLASLQFNINHILAYYSDKEQLRYVRSELPPEFDIANELQVAQAAYATYLQNNCYY